jgi:hypothetical protein
MRCLSRFVSVAALAATAIAAVGRPAQSASVTAIVFSDHTYADADWSIVHSFEPSVKCSANIAERSGGRPSWEESRHGHPLAESEGFLSLSHKRSRKIIAT